MYLLVDYQKIDVFLSAHCAHHGRQGEYIRQVKEGEGQLPSSTSSHLKQQKCNPYTK